MRHPKRRTKLAAVTLAAAGTLSLTGCHQQADVTIPSLPLTQTNGIVHLAVAWNPRTNDWSSTTITVKGPVQTAPINTNPPTITGKDTTFTPIIGNLHYVGLSYLEKPGLNYDIASYHITENNVSDSDSRTTAKEEAVTVTVDPQSPGMNPNGGIVNLDVPLTWDTNHTTYDQTTQLTVTVNGKSTPVTITPERAGTDNSKTNTPSTTKTTAASTSSEQWQIAVPADATQKAGQQVTINTGVPGDGITVDCASRFTVQGTPQAGKNTGTLLDETSHTVLLSCTPSGGASYRVTTSATQETLLALVPIKRAAPSNTTSTGSPTRSTTPESTHKSNMNWGLVGLVALCVVGGAGLLVGLLIVVPWSLARSRRILRAQQAQRELDASNKNVWAKALTEQSATDAEWLKLTGDLDTILEYPALLDPADPVTNKMILAMDRARRLHRDRLPKLPDGESVEHSDYVEAVAEYARLFEEAVKHAKNVRHANLSSREADLVRRVQDFLRLAVDGAASPNERQGAYAKAQELLGKLTFIPEQQRTLMVAELGERRVAGQLTVG